jgi:hypothetical protein
MQKNILATMLFIAILLHLNLFMKRLKKLLQSKTDPALQQKIRTQHTWQQAAEQTKIVRVPKSISTIMKLKIGIAGTRGIPNQYGGFEQFAACLSKGLVERGHDVTVYNTHNHPYQKKNGTA